MEVLTNFEFLGEMTMEWINIFGVIFIVSIILIIFYCMIWIICFRKNTVFRALALSIIPYMIFLFSGIMSRSVLLIFAFILFAPAHILISYKNAKS